MDDLEDSLKRLFQDPKLDVRVAPDADEKVVAGARRVRRNRIAMISSAGVLSLAVLAGGTFLVARPAPAPAPGTTGVATQPSDLPIESSPSSGPQVMETAPVPATPTTTKPGVRPEPPIGTKLPSARQIPTEQVAPTTRTSTRVPQLPSVHPPSTKEAPKTGPAAG